MQALEDQVPRLRADASASIRHRKVNKIRIPHPPRDAFITIDPSAGVKLGGVVDQVDEHLQNAGQGRRMPTWSFSPQFSAVRLIRFFAFAVCLQSWKWSAVTKASTAIHPGLDAKLFPDSTPGRFQKIPNHGL